MNRYYLCISFYIATACASEPQIQCPQQLTPLLTWQDAAQFAGLVVAYHHYPYETNSPFKPLVGPLGEPLSVGWLTNEPLTWKLLLDNTTHEGYGLKKLLSNQSLYQPSTSIDLTDYRLASHRIELRRLTDDEERLIIQLIAQGKARFDQNS